MMTNYDEVEGEMLCPVGLLYIDDMRWWGGGHLWWIYGVVTTTINCDDGEDAIKDDDCEGAPFFTC